MNNINDAYVGIEWEPQLTLLNYPKLSVYVLMTTFKNVEVKLKSNIDNIFYDHVLLFVPYEFFNKRIGVDQGVMNIEVRSEPVKLNNLKNEIEKCNIELADFIEKLTFYVGPVGVFIPSLYHKMREEGELLILTKHVNISLCPDYLYNEPIPSYYFMYDENMILKHKLYYKDKNKFHYCEFRFDWHEHFNLESQRIHTKVPYLFNDYESLVSAILNRESKYIIRYDNYDPKLIGYCKKDKYIIINGLT